MQERLIRVKNKAGIHCRPSGVILNAVNNEFPDDRFTVVTPAGETARKGALSSPLFKRLAEEVPGFRDRVARRWRELRDGPFRDDALDAWLDAHAALLAPSMTDDYRVSPPIGYDGDFPTAIAALRSEIHFRLSLLDRLFPAE